MSTIRYSDDMRSISTCQDDFPEADLDHTEKNCGLLNKFTWFQEMTPTKFDLHLIDMQIKLDQHDKGSRVSKSDIEPAIEENTKSKEWESTGFPICIRFLSSFMKPYPFSLDPTRKFLRSIFNISKNEKFNSDSPSSILMKQLRIEYCFAVLFNGLIKKKRAQLRQDSIVTMILTAKPDRNGVLTMDEPSLPVVTDIEGICDAVITFSPEEGGEQEEQFLVRILPSSISVASELDALVLEEMNRNSKAPTDGDPHVIQQKHETAVHEHFGKDTILGDIIKNEINAHCRYRVVRPNVGRNVCTLMLYANHIAGHHDQTVFWFLFMSDDVKWTISPVMTGVIPFQQLLLNLMCGGNVALDYLSMSRRPHMINSWCFQRTMEDPTLKMSTCFPEMRKSIKPCEHAKRLHASSESTMHCPYNNTTHYRGSFHSVDMGADMPSAGFLNDLGMGKIVDDDSLDTYNGRYPRSNFIPPVPQHGYSFNFLGHDESNSDMRRNSGNASSGMNKHVPHMLRARAQANHASNGQYFINSPAMHAEISHQSSNSNRGQEYHLSRHNPMFAGSAFTLPSWDTIKENRRNRDGLQESRSSYRGGGATLADSIPWPRPHR